MNTILQDDKILRAVSSISQRAERITNDEKITQTYVEVGMLRQITNKNNQIIYGRRGTGKTHLLRYLENDLKDQKKPIAVYIDCRTLGSASDYNNSEIPFEKRCITLFRDIINEFYDQALNSIVYNPPLESEKAINALDCISNAINFPEQKVVLKELSEKKLKKSSNEKSASISASTSRGIEAGIGQNTSTGVDTEQTSTYQVFDSKRISFPQFNLWMKKLIEYTHTDVFFLIDEWSSLPIDLQPYLAK